ncbi:ATP-binding protein [Streptomyces beihaiensis]|uniref:PspC domain-containing protein n=1 Tax=Streptomyces beihaiensis TaxID=2984495 RepID=A0ABT3TN12_9ACTN|nr:ATP-binding protein [Streptomyces beihaiensis]MCX3058382.1 PspC domain-containing protein [Streptomyces beihaiensis]
MPDPATTLTADDPRPPRKLYRSGDGRWLGGVARGLAGHLGLPVIWVRLIFVGLFMADGLGALLYAAFWFFVPLGVGGVDAERPPPPALTTETTPDGRRRLVARRPDKGQILALILMVIVATAFVQRVDLSNGTKAYLVPTVLVAAGVALVWRQADNARRARWMEVGRRRRTLNLARSAAGVLLVGAGVTGIFVTQGATEHLGAILQAALAVVVGIALLSGPYVIRMTQDLSEERLMRIRAQERAEVAAHVHDSVLHTLTLIQRNADRPAEVRRLARAQERDLRAWLYKPAGAQEPDEPETVAEAVKRNAAEVEDKHGVPLEVVVVGDCPLDERLNAQMQAAREAMVNAAKYGGEGGAVQVFAEVEGGTDGGGEVFVSVRDRGPGFDLDSIPADRMGVRESIIGRMERNGGTARLRAVPDGGTEVELTMKRAEKTS